MFAEKGTLYIYGNSGEGQNTAMLLRALFSARKELHTIAFINDYEQTGDFLGLPVLTFENALHRTEAEGGAGCFLIALGEPALRERLWEKVLMRGGRIAPPVAYPGFPEAVNLRVGNGSVIHNGVLMQPNVEVGENCLLNTNVVLGHDVKIGSHTVLSPNVSVGGFTCIGERSYIGIGAVLRDRIHIGDDCIIGMGAVVTRDVPDNQVVVGNPARVLRENVSKRVFKR